MFYWCAEVGYISRKFSVFKRLIIRSHSTIDVYGGVRSSCPACTVRGHTDRCETWLEYSQDYLREITLPFYRLGI